MPRGPALGMVAQLPEKDELLLSKKQLLAKMDVAMAGRVAEEIIFGPDSVTTGMDVVSNLLILFLLLAIFMKVQVILELLSSRVFVL
jgi:hypothetical protein